MVLKRAAPVVLAGILMYVLAPVLIKVLSAWPRLGSLRPAWAVAGLVAEAASFTCTFFLKRIALRTKAIFAVVTSALVGNAVTNVLPGADATGATAEFSLLSAAGVETGAAISGLTATALLQTGCLLALPVLTLPAILAGAPISPGLAHLVYLGLVIFAVYAVGGFVIFQTDGPLRLVGRFAQDVRNRVLRHRQAMTDLPERLVDERNSTRAALGARWWQAWLYATGRVVLDFVCLLAMLAAARTTPKPWLVLIAYVATTVIALLPLTPGGLGLVEGSLTGLLVLAGIPASKAVLSTLAYRLASYWIPSISGPFAYIAFQSRYHATRGQNDPSSQEDRTSLRGS
ncbi:MAG TPA: lysylphosphatidylglycerol synthase transmembrane domain-containing protein [Acidimicrobiales bacterium]|nr:lysylphosphatidylglycerol synthase transmembrane domain-containing protein [Acidimicrobiales bacterium]